jgi:uncharacterized repeat protein (TIGR01451 family)
MGQTVVILDTGIDVNHPFFGGRVVTEACWSNAAGAGSGTSLCPGGGNSQTGNGSADALTTNCMSGGVSICDHGSHVAGIAAGRDPGGAGATGYSGIAPEANIIAIQVFTRFNTNGDCDNNPPCVKTYDSDQISALNYVNDTLRTNWSISSVNMSLGGGMYTAACDGDARKASIDNLLSNGIATVISSGNDDWTDALGAPGCVSTAVTVGNVFDPADDVTDNMHAVVDLLAAGRNVDSSVPDDAYANMSGTSMAAPEVTGAFAMIRAIRPSMSIADILALLQETGVLVRDERAPNPPDANAGHVKPRIQLDAALAAVTQADLRVFKDCKPDDPMLVGATATCTIVIENLGPDAAMDVTAVDDYVSNGSFEFGAITPAASCTSTPNPQNGSGAVSCDLGGMEPGARITIQIPVTASAPQNIDDRVIVASRTPDPNAANNVAEDGLRIVESADLRVSKDCKPDEPVFAGVEAVCTIFVDNLGPAMARNVRLTDAHLSDGTFSFGTVTPGTCTAPTIPQVGSGNVTCNLGDLPAGARAIVVVPVSATEPMDINDQATVASDTADPVTGNNSATDSVRVRAISDLSVTKSDLPDPVVAGTNLTYDLAVLNAGPSGARNVLVRDMLPAGVTIVSVSAAGGTCNFGEPGNAAKPTTCTFDSLNAGGSSTMQIVVTVLPGTTGILHNDAGVSSANYDPDNSNDLASTDTTVRSEADLSIAKVANPSPAVAGKKLTYEVTISNGGPSTARTVTLSDQLPPEVTFVSATISNGAGTCVLQNVPPNTVFCNLNDLNPGQYVKVFIETLVAPSAPDGANIANTATTSSTTPDLNTGNNTATIQTMVDTSADLAITKDARVDYTNPSPRVIYTLRVTNNGPSDAQGVQVVDTLPLTPKKIVYLFDTGNGSCSYAKSTHKLTCTVGTLAAGASWSVDIYVDARGSVGTISNNATVTSGTSDPNAGNNSVRKDIKIKGGPGTRSAETDEPFIEIEELFLPHVTR